MRYILAEQSIAAAGAAFAHVEDDSVAIGSARREAAHGAAGWRRSLWRILLITCLVVT